MVPIPLSRPTPRIGGGSVFYARANNMPTVKDHDFAIYDLHLSFCGGSKGNDLLHEISSSTAYVVDNNVAWKRLASTSPDTVFVLGATIEHEADNLQGVLFGRRSGTAEFPNVFALGLEPSEKGIRLVIHRVDESFIVCFKGPLPRLEEMSEAEVATFNCPAKRDHLRRVVYAQMQRSLSALDSEIAAVLPLCRFDYQKSCLAAELIYARFLLSLGKAESQKERKKFLENHPNLFGDTRLIQEALVLGVGIVTCDVRDVVNMAAIARVTAKRPEQFATPKAPRPSG